MADRYGIVVTLKAKEGKIDELIAIAKGHFVRQHDGREPNATCASIVLPLPGEPNTLRFFEQVRRVVCNAMHHTTMQVARRMRNSDVHIVDEN